MIQIRPGCRFLDNRSPAGPRGPAWYQGTFIILYELFKRKYNLWMAVGRRAGPSPRRGPPRGPRALGRRLAPVLEHVGQGLFDGVARLPAGGGAELRGVGDEQGLVD